MILPYTGKTRARAPLRLGLAGGGTDLSPYCDQFGGAVLNVTIDRYAFASVIPNAKGEVLFAADDMESREIYTLDDPTMGRLNLHRGVYERMMAEFNDGKRLPLTVATTVDAPPGSGLGSSSALVVALVSAFAHHLEAPLGDYDIARLAFEIERQDLGLSGGRQDQYSAAFGGVNFIEFLDGERVIVNPLRVPDSVQKEFESSIVIAFSGRSRNSADIIDQQKSGLNANDQVTLDAMHQLKADAVAMKRAFLTGDIAGMAEILNTSWQAKQATASGVSTVHLEKIFKVALDNGALAGKVSGAGGGGFMFFLAPPERRYRLMSALTKVGADASPVMFSQAGCESWRC